MTDIHPFVRIPRSALQTLDAYHIATGRHGDGFAWAGAMRWELKMRGYARWGSAWREARLFVSWDWGLVKDLIVVLHPERMETNLQLLTESGQLEVAALTKIHLLEWIESLPWRERVTELALRNL